MSISISGNGTFTGANSDYSFDQSVGIAGTLTYEDVTNIDSVGVITARSGINVGPTSGIGITLTSGGNITASGTGMFADTIQSAGNPVSGTATGAQLNSSGGVWVSNASATQSVFRGYTTGNSSETVRINANGSATFAGNITLSTAGSGIDFSATADGSGTTTSELLDDYEEGTWTPGYDTSVTSSTAITYNNQTGGSYIKIGRAVYICGRVRTNSNQSLDGTGFIVLTGLPFAISDGFDGSSDTQDTYAVISVQQIDGWTESPLLLLAQAGGSVLDLYNGTTLSEPVVVADFNTGGSGINRMRFSGFYFTDD